MPHPEPQLELTLDQEVSIDQILADWDLNMAGLREQLKNNLAQELASAVEKERERSNTKVNSFNRHPELNESKAGPCGCPDCVFYRKATELLTPPKESHG